MTFRLESERVVIRPWQESDRDAFYTMARDPEVMRFVHGGEPYSEEEADQFFARQAHTAAQHHVCMGALVEKSSDRVIGVAGAQPLGTTGDFEIGWWLARDFWGRGFATEAGRIAMTHVLETMGLPRVRAIIDPGNRASVAVVTRLGMTYDGRFTGAQLGHRLPEIVVDVYSRDRQDGTTTA
jgi:[ribosomal protein S5]-alanine N-acetyltransferase